LPPAQQRFDGGEVAEDLLTVGIGLPKVGGAAPGHTLEDHAGWSAQQHDGVEPRVELALVRDAAGDEEQPVVVLREKGVDPVFSPEPLRALLDPVAVVRVHHAVASVGELGQSRRLPRSGHPGHERHGH
jgi:hypothetical protein